MERLDPTSPHIKSARGDVGNSNKAEEGEERNRCRDDQTCSLSVRAKFKQKQTITSKIRENDKKS